MFLVILSWSLLVLWIVPKWAAVLKLSSLLVTGGQTRAAKSKAASFQHILFFLLVWAVLRFLSTARLSHTALRRSFNASVCVFASCIYPWDQDESSWILVLQITAWREIRNMISVSVASTEASNADGLYWRFMFWVLKMILFSPLFLCSHGCASIWEVAWTLHGHYEEEYNTLWGATGGNVWL